MREDDWTQIQSLYKTFASMHMAYLIQSLTFEKMNEGSLKESLTLMNMHIRNQLDAFRSD